MSRCSTSTAGAGPSAASPGYLRKKFNIRIVKFDVETETPVRGANGCCIEAGPGEIGECIGHIASDARSNFTGYADKAATEKKILHDVFEKGDAWFRTGDLMRSDGDGYLYFVDRIGDTFRWKGENVATSEVSERLSAVAGVKEVNVYGVPVGELDGKAGMASLVVGSRVRDRRPGRICRPRAAGLRPPDLRAPAARRSRPPAPSSTARSTWSRRASTRPYQGSAVFPRSGQGLCEADQGGSRQDPGRRLPAVGPFRRGLAATLGRSPTRAYPGLWVAGPQALLGALACGLTLGVPVAKRRIQVLRVFGPNRRAITARPRFAPVIGGHHAQATIPIHGSLGTATATRSGRP
jgi:hypothetical protein